jgi:hypothetical protein
MRFHCIVKLYECIWFEIYFDVTLKWNVHNLNLIKI